MSSDFKENKINHKSRNNLHVIQRMHLMTDFAAFNTIFLLRE
jgi:hypothetical protein